MIGERVQVFACDWGLFVRFLPPPLRHMRLPYGLRGPQKQLIILLARPGLDEGGQGDRNYSEF